MENLGIRIKKSGQGLHQEGAKFLTETQDAGRHFARFIHDEAKGWGGYLREQAQQLNLQGRELIHPERPVDNIWVHLDHLMAKVRHQVVTDEAPTEAAPIEAAPEPKAEEESQASS
jgi:hypothetical protein